MEGEGMASIQQAVDVEVSPEVARAEWARFTEWVLVGNYKLLCDALSCEIMADHESVTYEQLREGRTRVRVQFLYEPADASDPGAKEQLVRARLAHDLAAFAEFVESDVHSHHRHSRAEHKAIVDSEVRKGQMRRTGESLVERDESDSYGPPHYMA
jgi:hypothetical protein